MNLDGLLQYGAMGIMLAYCMWERNSTMKDFRNSLDSLKETIQIIRTEIEVRKEDNK